MQTLNLFAQLAAQFSADSFKSFSVRAAMVESGHHCPLLYVSLTVCGRIEYQCYLFGVLRCQTLL